jgi:protease-4
MKRLFFLFFLLVNSELIGFGQRFKEFFIHKNEEPVAALNQVAVQPTLKIIEIPNEFNSFEKAKEIICAAKNPKIYGILLIINSGGGYLQIHGMLFDLVKKVTEYKPVITFVSGVACSGAYLVASASNYIVAGSFSDLGSIGVVRTYEHYKDGIAKANGNIEADLEFEMFIAGKFKGLGHRCFGKFSEQQRAYINESLEKDYQFFLKAIAESRNLNLEEKDIWAEGKLFIGEEALNLGLIDEVGTLLDAEAKLVELIKERNSEINFEGEVVYCE